MGLVLPIALVYCGLKSKSTERHLPELPSSLPQQLVLDARCHSFFDARYHSSEKPSRFPDPGLILLRVCLSDSLS